MDETFRIVYLARHGETAWTIRRLGLRLGGLKFAKVFTSPLQGARRTCELAAFGGEAQVDPDLAEWNYGEYEGRPTSDILKERPDWQLFRDGCPGGESPQQVAARADRVVSRVRRVIGDVLIFSSGDFLRVLAVRWIGLEPIGGQSLMLSTASLSALSYENSPLQPAIRFWNDTHHLAYSLDEGRSQAEERGQLTPHEATR